MRHKRFLFPVLAFGLILSWAFSLQAEIQDKVFSAQFMLGYRSVSTSGLGAEYKYREDINLKNGVRLFNFNLQYSADEKLKKFFDHIDLNVHNFGGDPFETFGLSVQKYGKYLLQYDRKKSTYFYNDRYEIGGALYDVHSFDFDRISDSGLFKYWLSNKADIYLNFDRFSKNGTSITTLDINRVEFKFDKPIKEDSKEVTVGVNLHLSRYSLVLEEKFLDYSNTNSLFLPGYADGGAEAFYPSSLSLFNLNQPYDIKANTHTLKFSARPLSSLLISGSALLSKQDLDLTYSEEAEGVNYLDRIFAYSSSGQGSFSRKVNLFDFDMTYMLYSKLAVVGAVRYHDFDQNGFLTIDGEENRPADIGFHTLSFEAGLQYQFSSRLALTLGYRNEARKLEGIEESSKETSEETVTEPFETAAYEDKTQRNGFFGNLKLSLSPSFNLTADYQRGDDDNPFTIISPTSFDRFRLTAKFKVNKFSASGSYLLNNSKSKVFEDSWTSNKKQLSLRVGYHAARAQVFIGYSMIDVESKADRLIAYRPYWTGPGGTFPWTIDFEGKSSLFDASVSLNVGPNWKIGAYANSYTNKGFWEIGRTTFKGYVEYAFANGLISQLGYRHVNFNEKSHNANDYKANILEISFGYRWK